MDQNALELIQVSVDSCFDPLQRHVLRAEFAGCSFSYSFHFTSLHLLHLPRTESKQLLPLLQTTKEVTCIINPQNGNSIVYRCLRVAQDLFSPTFPYGFHQGVHRQRQLGAQRARECYPILQSRARRSHLPCTQSNSMAARTYE